MVIIVVIARVIIKGKSSGKNIVLVHNKGNNSG